MVRMMVLVLVLLGVVLVGVLTGAPLVVEDGTLPHVWLLAGKKVVGGWWRTTEGHTSVLYCKLPDTVEYRKNCAPAKL